jgi:nitroreductase
MNFAELIKQRYSVRAYQPNPVEADKLQQVLEAARLAPTAANRQPFQVIVIHTQGREEELRRVYHRSWFHQAPLVIAVVGLPGNAWTRRDGQNYVFVDAAIVIDHITLAATDLGLGTCWVAAFDPAAAREVLGLPPEAEPVAFTPLGYPADTLRPKERKSLAELVRYERW